MDDSDHDSDVELSSFNKRPDDSLDLDREDPITGRSLQEESNLDSVATATLSWQEKKNLALLYALYMIHVLPLSFSWYTMPILIRQQLNYTLLGTYLVSQYPYSIKILWAPIVQSKYIPALGRRKSWIVPCFLCGGLVLFWLGFHQDELIDRIADGELRMMLWLVVAWFVLTIFCANLRIALDDWSLDLLSQANVHWASTVVTLSEMSGAFFSFVLFLGLSSLGHPNAGTNGEETSTRLYFCLVGFAFTIMSILVLVFKSSKAPSSVSHSKAKADLKPSTLRSSYTIIIRILQLRQVWTLMLVHMTSMIGFQANDAIAILQLVKNGFSDRDIAALAAISIPLEFLGSILITRTFRKYSPLEVWRKLFPLRLLVALTTQVGVLLVTRYRAHHWRWFIALLPYLASKQLEDCMFISLMAFHSQVADPLYGGIYLPLLATTLNIRYDAMGFLFTKTVGWIDGGEVIEHVAEQGDGPASVVIDGYQIVNLCAVLVAVPVFWFFLRPATMWLQETKRAEWRVGDGIDRGSNVAGYVAVPAADGYMRTDSSEVDEIEGEGDDVHDMDRQRVS